MKFVNYLPLLLPLCLLVPANGSATPKDKQTTFSRESLLKKTVTLPSPQVEAEVIRVRFPVGYKTPMHTHEGPGPRYVLKGRLRIEDSGESNVYGAGEVFWESGSEMTVENVGKGEAEIVIFQMAPAK